MARLIYHPEAQAELREAAAYYQKRRGGLGEKLLEAVQEITAKAHQNPRRCSPISPVYRCCRVERFPYGVVYRVDGDDMFVVAVMHFKRKPGYWKGRESSPDSPR